MRSGGAVELEHAGHAFQQLALRAALGHAPRQRLAGIDHGLVERVLLVAALGMADLDLVAGRERQRAFQQLALGDVVAGQDQLGRLARFVELADEGRQHGGPVEILGVAGEIGAIAEVLPGAQEEHLHANLPALEVRGEDVGLVDRRQGDRLVRLDVGQRADAVAQDGGAFEFETDRGLLHALGQCLLDLAVAPAQEAAHLVDDGAVLGLVDAADAGRRAALDLVLQAGPGAGREHAVGAGAQREGALQGIERAVDRGGRGEGAEILVLRVAHAAMLGELRPFGVAADDDVGERLVVAQQHVEARLEALDQVVLEQQGLGLAAGDRELHGLGARDHAQQAVVEPRRLGVGGDAAPERARLADIEDLAVGRDHAVDARLARQGVHELADDAHAVGQRAFAGRGLLGRFQVDVGFVTHEVLPQAAIPTPAPGCKTVGHRRALWGAHVGKSVNKPGVSLPLRHRHCIDSM